MVEKELPTEEEALKFFDAWGQRWVDMHMDFPRMTENQTKVLLQLLMAEKAGKDLPEEQFTGLFLYAIFTKRAEFILLKTSQQARLMVSYVCTSPGDAVMYLYALKWMAAKAGVDKVTLSEVCEGFPVGFPDEEQRLLLWDAQKVDGVNLLDLLSFKSDNPHHAETAVS